MRHRVKGNKLGRTASHRLATQRALAVALLKHKKIKTTLAKAKATRSFVEPLITKAKNDSVHARRYVAKYINDREVVSELFGDIVNKIGDRPGGYTRVIKLGNRFSDSAEMAMIELVDYNDLEEKKSKTAKKKKAVEDVETEVVEKKSVKDEAKVDEAEVIEESAEAAKDAKEVKPKEEKKAKGKVKKKEEKKTEDKKDAKVEAKEKPKKSTKKSSDKEK